jgi:hypothetical protein
MHGSASGAVSGDGDGIDEPDGKTGGVGGVEWMGQVICIYPYGPLILLEKMKGIKRYGY